MLLNFKDIEQFSKTYSKTDPNLFFLKMKIQSHIFDKINITKMFELKDVILLDENNYFIRYSNVVFDCYNNPMRTIGFRGLIKYTKNITWDKKKFQSEYLKLLLNVN